MLFEEDSHAFYDAAMALSRAVCALIRFLDLGKVDSFKHPAAYIWFALRRPSVA